jgi:hypothetical protein
MLNDILFVAFIFATRIALPMIATYILGHLIERALHNEARPRVTRAMKLTERHIG